MVGPPRGEHTPMHRSPTQQDLPRAHVLTQRAFAAFERFLHIEAASGIVLLIAAAIALIWANSTFADSYHALWHLPFSIGIGHLTFSQSLHFIINDGLMTVFFLVVGMEIRREIHQGALSNIRQASLPIMAAIGGVIVPALMYVSMNTAPAQLNGWAVPTATDIAFAVGVLALLGKGIPSNVRVFLLALAIIDDIIAVLIIAVFYSGGLNPTGFMIAAMGIFIVLGFRRMGIGSAFAYIVPGAIVWIGLLMTGAHPTLAGVVLGMLTPVVSLPTRQRPADMVAHAARTLSTYDETTDTHHVNQPLKQLRLAQREVLPPVVRVQMALHPWVAFGIMPLFALANAGVSMGGIDLSVSDQQWVMTGVGLALVLGKPIGVIGVSLIAVKLGISRLPPDVTWGGITLIGLLAGVGFTMSIFIAMLAYDSEALLGAAKLGVLVGSVIAAILGLIWGYMYRRIFQHR
jgi:NhaA family Na+:H+ antiporter